MANRHNSGYLVSLSVVEQDNYRKKCKLFCEEDPYELTLEVCEKNVDFWPKINHGDIYNYLVFSTHSVTSQQMKAFKSLDSHNYFTSGFVNAIFTKTLNDEKVIVLGEVKHSQSLNSSPEKVWILVKKSGEVITAHCTCMAGLGEACSHIGAILFAIETGVRLNDDRSCTQEKSSWLPAHSKQFLYQPISEMDFSSSEMKKRKLDTCTASTSMKSSSPTISSPTSDELSIFFKKLSETQPKAAILTILPEFNAMFEPANKIDPIDKILLNNMYNNELSKLTWPALINHCKSIFHSDALCVTKTVALKVEQITKAQAKCSQWFAFRQGRITASIMKSVCHTDIKKPSLSLLKKICFPPKKKISSLAISWGCSHEKIAREFYIQRMCKSHHSFKLEESGFHINPDFPHVGATPDGIVSCSCCGKGICEIKCPFCNRNENVENIAATKQSCLIQDEASNLHLDKQSGFFYQIQTQLFVCDVDYCDFILWTTKDVHVERIFPDFLFWETTLEKCSNFFLFVVLPELIAKWHSSKSKK